MINIETFLNLNYRDEEAVMNNVKSWVAANNHSTSLAQEIMYVFHYDLHAGDFEKLDIVKKNDYGAYTDKNFITIYKRLVVYHDGQGNFYLYFDGRQVRGICSYWQGYWKTDFFDYLKKPFAVFKAKYS